MSIINIPYAWLALVLVGCSTVAVTGRSQLSLVSDQDLMRVSDQNYLSLVSTAKKNNAIVRSSDSPEAAKMIAMVNRVSDRIIDASGYRSKRNWEVVVVNSRVPNAMVLPSGKIIVFSGILPISKTEAGLAAVLGHEVAHVMARHAAERISQTLLADTVFRTASAIASIKNTKHQPAISAALGLGLQFGVLMPFSRSHESEADRIGQLLMAKAGYDPAEATGIWERMDLLSGKSKLEFMSTHPAHEKRQNQLKEWLPQARLFYEDQKRPLPSSITELEVALREVEKRVIAPIALKPAIREDYWYKMQASTAESPTLVRYDKIVDCDFGKCITVQNSKNGSYVNTIDYGIVMLTKPDGSWLKFSKPVRPVKFPLAVGDQWEDLVVLETSDGKKAKGTLKSRVISYEPIDVPAGSFLAYRTEVTGGGKLIFEGWYVPETRGFVKTISHNQGKEVVSVMTDYQKSDDPSGELARADGGPI